MLRCEGTAPACCPHTLASSRFSSSPRLPWAGSACCRLLSQAAQLWIATCARADHDDALLYQSPRILRTLILTKYTPCRMHMGEGSKEGAVDGVRGEQHGIALHICRDITCACWSRLTLLAGAWGLCTCLGKCS